MYTQSVGRDSVIGKATRYELNGPGIESRSREQPPVQWVQGPFPGDEAAGAWR